MSSVLQSLKPLFTCLQGNALQLHSVCTYTHTAHLHDHIDGWLQKHTQTRTHSLPTRSHRHGRLLVRESLLTRLNTDSWSPVRETETHTYSPAYKTDGWLLVRKTETHTLTPCLQDNTDSWTLVRETETHTYSHFLPTRQMAGHQ